MEPEFLETLLFKKRLLDEGDKLPTNLGILKAYTPDITLPDITAKQALDEGLTARFVMNTADVDRDGDIVKPVGGKLDHFKKNPVGLWAHDHDIPAIVQWANIEQTTSALSADAIFPAKDLHPFGNMIGRLVLAKFLRACSIGFKMLKWSFVEDRSGGSYWSPMDVEEWEMWECSICNVPANPFALADAKSAGIDMAPMVAWAEQILDRAKGAGVDGIWMPRSQVIDTFKALTARPVVVPAVVRPAAPAKSSDDAPLVPATPAAADLPAPPPTTETSAPTTEDAPPAATTEETPADDVKGAVVIDFEAMAVQLATKAGEDFGELCEEFATMIKKPRGLETPAKAGQDQPRAPQQLTEAELRQALDKACR